MLYLPPFKFNFQLNPSQKNKVNILIFSTETKFEFKIWVISMSSQKSSFYFQNSFPVPPLFQPPRISSKLSDFPINFLNFNEEEISRKQINDDYVNVSEFNLEEEKNRENMQNPNDFEDNNFLKKKPEQTDFVKKNINPGCLMEIEEESRTPSNAFNSSAEKTPTKSSRVSNYGVDATVVNKFPRNEGGGSNNNIIK